MHGSQRKSFSRQMASIKRRQQKPVRTIASTLATPQDTNTRVDVGDWSLAQDENGALIIHNVMTGNRVIIATAEEEE